MKLLKIIEILKDIAQWESFGFLGGLKHKPTGVKCYNGDNFWKDSDTIYETNPLFAIFTGYYVKVIRKHIKNRNKNNNLDEIYNKWQLEYKNQSY